MIYWNCYIGDFVFCFLFFFKGSNFDYFAKRPQSWKSYFGPNHLLPRSKSYTRIQGSPDIGPSCRGLRPAQWAPSHGSSRRAFFLFSRPWLRDGYLSRPIPAHDPKYQTSPIRVTEHVYILNVSRNLRHDPNLVVYICRWSSTVSYTM